jgi:uncharacterized membrane protein YesL
VSFLWECLKHFNARGYLYIWANLAFIAVSLPIITIPVGWAALVRLSHLAQTSPRVDLHDFWQACRENFWRGLGIGFVSLLVLWINLSNLYSYRYETGYFIWLMRGIWLGTLFFWFSLQIYLWPLYYEMAEPNLLTAFRNAFIMILRNPLFTLGLWVLIILVAFLSSIFPAAWILLSISFFACLSASATMRCLRLAGYLVTSEIIHEESASF